jgi:cytoskeletal protein CcmA (bactofilin family)
LKFKKEFTLGQSQENFESIIGTSLVIKGDIVISKGIRIDGKLFGNVVQEENQNATVAISESAEIVGDIHAQHVIVSGKLTGNIFALERVELLSNSCVEGNIQYGSIGIAVGAKIHGNLNEYQPGGESPVKLISHKKA